MSDIKIQLSNLKIKVEKLVNLHEQIQSDNTRLIKSEEFLKDKISIQLGEILELKEKNRLIKMANAVTESDQNTRDVKIKLNEYIREIDKCIALINH